MENILLNLLPARDLERFLRDCEQIELPQRDVLIETDEVMTYAFFPTSALVSQLAVLTDGNAIETGAIGRDGYVGLSSHYAAELSPSRFTVQIPGEAWRMPTTKL